MRIVSSLRLVLQQFRHDLAFQRGEGLRVAEELGDADQQVAEQQIELVGLLAQALDVIGHIIDLQHLHAALDAPDQGVLLVLAKIVAEPGAQQGADPRQMLRCVATRAVRRLPVVDAAEVLRVRDQPRRHLLDRQHLVDETGGGSAARHAEQCRFIKPGLGEGEAAMLLDGFEPPRAVAAAAGQDDRRRPFSA